RPEMTLPSARGRVLNTAAGGSLSWLEATPADATRAEATPAAASTSIRWGRPQGMGVSWLAFFIGGRTAVGSIRWREPKDTPPRPGAQTTGSHRRGPGAGDPGWWTPLPAGS